MVVGEYQPKTELTYWDEYVDRQIGQKRAAELRNYQVNLYAGMMYGTNKFLKTQELMRWVDTHRVMILDVERAYRYLEATRMHGRGAAEDQSRLFDSKMSKLRKDMRSTAPAASAEQAWAGYDVSRVDAEEEGLTAERAFRRSMYWI